MGKFNDLAEAGDQFSRLAHGIESNMESLQVLRSRPGVPPEQKANLERVIRAQLQLLSE